MSILIKGLPLGGYEISIMKDGERYRARVDGIWCEVEEIPTTDTDTDTISRAKAIETIDSFNVFESRGDQIKLEQMIGELPSAQPQRIKGRWVVNGTLINCSVCGHCSWSRSTFERTVRSFKFCPNCGADMREVTT